MRSLIVDLPWSMCATIEKLRMWEMSIEVFMRTILPERYKKWSLFHKTGSIYARNLCDVKFTT